MFSKTSSFVTFQNVFTLLPSLETLFCFDTEVWNRSVSITADVFIQHSALSPSERIRTSFFSLPEQQRPASLTKRERNVSTVTENCSQTCWGINTGIKRLFTWGEERGSFSPGIRRQIHIWLFDILADIGIPTTIWHCFDWSGKKLICCRFQRSSLLTINAIYDRLSEWSRRSITGSNCSVDQLLIDRFDRSNNWWYIRIDYQ